MPKIKNKVKELLMKFNIETVEEAVKFTESVKREEGKELTCREKEAYFLLCDYIVNKRETLIEYLSNDIENWVSEIIDKNTDILEKELGFWGVMSNNNPFPIESLKQQLDKVSKEQEGVKNNKAKLEMSVIFKQFPNALKATMLASSYGHLKYLKNDADHLNFKRVKGGSNTYADAGIRHMIEGSYDFDDESGLPHIFHECFNKLAQCELWIEEQSMDINNYVKESLNSWKHL